MFGLPNPSLEFVHASAGLSRRFRNWFDKACKNYGELLELGGVVDNVLRRERLEELTGVERTRFTEALMEHDKLEDGLSNFAKLKSFKDFVSFTDENLIKWVGDEIVSLGYCGFRERSSQYWLLDYRAEKLPYERKVREVFAFYGLETRLQIYGLRIPSLEQAESWLLEFLENIKKWPRERLVWLIRNRYPLSDDAGGFWTAVRQIVELMSLRDAWEDIIEDWKRAVFLRKTPEFEVLKTVLASEWEADRYLRDLGEELEKEFLDKYGDVTADMEKVKEEFYDRAPELLRERVVSEERLREVYEQVKPIAPEKAELKKAGLWKAIRWAFLHPQMSVDAFASGHVFPLDFTTEEARAIASRIMEKVAKKPPVVAPPPPLEYVQVRFLKEVPAIVGADMKVYGPFKEGDVVELPKPNAEAFVKAEAATYELVPPAIPKVTKETGEKAKAAPAPVPPELPTEEIERLRRVVRVETDELGLMYSPEVWDRFWREYEARARELWATRHISYLQDEIQDVLRAVTPPPIAPPPVKPPVPKERVARVGVPPVGLPMPLSPEVAFPRRPTSIEKQALFKAFREALAERGIDPAPWHSTFVWRFDWPFKNWEEILREFREMINDIVLDRVKIRPPIIPWETFEEAIKHFFAINFYPNIDAIVEALSDYGIFTTRDEVIKTVIESWKAKDDVRIALLTKQQLAERLGIPLENIQ